MKRGRLTWHDVLLCYSIGACINISLEYELHFEAAIVDQWLDLALVFAIHYHSVTAPQLNGNHLANIIWRMARDKKLHYLIPMVRRACQTFKML